MKTISTKTLQEILAPLNIPLGLILCNSPVLTVVSVGNRQQEYLQLERARMALVNAGLDAVEADARTVVVRGGHPDPEFVKFMRATPPGSDGFEGLAHFKTAQKLWNE